jgi:thiol-disulfide isomerase/thioredoxin
VQSLGNICLLLVCFSLTSCQGRESTFPLVEPVDHRALQDIVGSQKGSVVLVNIWATWCAPCREEMPALVKVHREFRDKGFSLVLVSTDEVDLLRTRVQPMLKEFGVDFPSYIYTGDEEALIAAMHPEWRGALPTSFLYDRNGNLVEMMVGRRTLEQFTRAVRTLIES